MNIDTVGIVGAGTMGSGIAQVCAIAGLKVELIDISDTAVQRGIDSIASSLDRMVKKAKVTGSARDDALARIAGGTDYSSLAATDLVIEAATENVELKLRLLRQIDAVTAAGGTLIASNTSSISITQLAAVLERPARFIGMHFFNPVPMLELVELIRGLQTSDATHEAAQAFAKTIGKTPVTVRNSPGFVVNRILVPMINEAVFTLQEGLATVEDIDNGMKLGCGHPIGPLALADLIGLDTLLAVMQVLHEGFGDPKYRPAPLLREMVDAGRLGRKGGQGFFDYR